MTITVDTVWQALDDVKDPEIPVVSLVEMGIIRQVEIADNAAKVTMTPTFSGCPALHVMEEEITAKLQEMGFDSVEVKRSLNPPWSSDWITDEARQKLKQFGLAPPRRHGGNLEIMLFETVSTCPYCDSPNTSVKNEFGPTRCRSIHYCNNCQQPFEQFKPL
ncbi:MAG: 1,2-phenylacetyl-CoA epoxidase subunit PaaD [Chloroflexota bacterium]